MEFTDFVKGTCEFMCPNKELQLRTKEKILHFYEQNPPEFSSIHRQYNKNNNNGYIIIKEFARSAAGIRTPRPSDLRTPKALFQTIEYLLEKILPNNRKPFWHRYEFIFDRLRCIRQEIVIQNFDLDTTVWLLEPIVLFLAYSSYRLCEVPIDHFDPYVCNQHLQECLKKLLSCYDELYRIKNVIPKCRYIFECLYLILNLGHTEAIQRMIQKKNHEIFTNLTKLCLEMSLNYLGANFYKVLININKLPHILCGVAVVKLQIIRREMLLRFSEAYHSKVLRVSCEWLKKVLLYSSDSQVLEDCKYYNCLHIENDQKFYIQFNRTDFNRLICVIQPRQELFADKLFNNISSISSVLLLDEF